MRKTKKFKAYLKEFKKWYSSSDTHFYVTKAKTFEIDSLIKLRKGLILISNWFVEQNITAKEKKHFTKFILGKQKTLTPIAFESLLTWNNKVQLYFAYLLETNNLISERNRAPKVFKEYQKIVREIHKGRSHDQLKKKDKKKVLNDFAANARNFKNMYEQLGFAWLEEDRMIHVTSTGERFIQKVPEKKLESHLHRVMEQQAIKWQLSNPKTPPRYKDLEIFPYLFILKLLLNIEGTKAISKDEYALFVSRAQLMGDFKNIKKRVNEYRKLKDEEKAELCKVAKSIKRQPRNLYEEIIDATSKEISFFGSTGIIKRETVGNSLGLVLANKKNAENIVKTFESSGITYIDFEDNKDDWFNYYGDWDETPTPTSAIHYYQSIGKTHEIEKIMKKSEEVIPLGKAAIQEYQIEEYYVNNLNLLESRLRLYIDEYGRKGRQFSTEVGRIDILCLDSKNNYVVVEFKRNWTSDKVVGQTLRYMGWVNVNLANGRKVRGIIIAKEFDYKLKYAIVGLQYPENKKLVHVKKHHFEMEDMDAGESLREELAKLS